jgi:hypothetical protein
VQASGKGTAWATASAPQSGLFGYVQLGANFNLGNEFVGIEDRGEWKHSKRVRTIQPGGQFSVLEGITGDWPDAGQIATASGATVPMIHLEFKMEYVELGAGSGYYFQFMGVPWPGGVAITEAENGNTRQYTWQGLSANGPTASGYLS